MKIKFLPAVLLAFASHAGAADLPPAVGIPPGELVHPGSLAEAKAGRELDYGVKLLKMPEAWEKNKKSKGAGVKVAVLDTGGDITHPWLKPNVKGTYNAINKSRDVTDRQGHGTHCCGTVVEVAPEVELLIVKVLGDNGSGSVVDIAHGIDYAVEWGADVISMSLGGPSADPYSPKAITAANKAGVIVVAAAGNDGPGDGTDGYPARYPECVSVAACDSAKAVANFSSRGGSVYTIAPGVQVLSALPGGKQGRMSGTSMATPHMAGVAAGWCACSNLAKKDRPAAFKQALKDAGATPNVRSRASGYGLPDVSKAVSPGTVTPPPPPTPGPVGSISIELADLTAAAQKRLQDAGVKKFKLDIEYGPGVIPAVPEKMPATLYQWPDGTIRYEAPARFPVLNQLLPAKAAGRWEYRCNGKECVLVWVP